MFVWALVQLANGQLLWNWTDITRIMYICAKMCVQENKTYGNRKALSWKNTLEIPPMLGIC